MADDADRSDREIELELELERGIAGARGDTPTGVQGECDHCGEWFARLVKGVCIPCRNMDEIKKRHGGLQWLISQKVRIFRS